MCARAHNHEFYYMVRCMCLCQGVVAEAILRSMPPLSQTFRHYYVKIVSKCCLVKGCALPGILGASGNEQVIDR